MSVTNPERVVTKQDLADFYDELLPFISPKSYAGFTPIGTIIQMVAESAPANYLICNGATYNKSDYPELAAHLLSMTSHSMYEVSGDNTKFKVPDLRGEFLRGTGSNSHAYQGSGANVGVHQDSTRVPVMCTNEGASVGLYIERENTSSANQLFKNFDATTHPTYSKSYTHVFTRTSASERTDNRAIDGTIRPTNTSVLFCIATKNIYLDPKNDYSTEEKVIGTWIDGKTLYQKTVIDTLPTTTTDGVVANKFIPLNVSIDTVVDIESIFLTNNQAYSEFGYIDSTSNVFVYIRALVLNEASGGTNKNSLRLATSSSASAGIPARITIRYTKTT